MRLDAVRQDLSYALRGFRRSPGLTAAILATFALGIGVNSALFTVVDRLFFQAPPGVADPAAVRRLIYVGRGFGQSRSVSDYFTTKDITHFRDAAGRDAEVEGYDPESNRTIGNDPQRRTVGYATTGFFRLAGIRPERGRFFADDENRIGDPRRLAVLSHDYWQHAFAADTAVLGRTIRIDSLLYTVIGVAPPRFVGMNVDAVDVWAPLAALPAGLEGSLLNGDFEIVQLFARIAPGVDPTAVEARLNVQFRRDRSFVLTRDSTIRLETAPLLQARSALALGQQNERNLALIVRLAGVGLVVLIVAVTNVASLLLMRALRRRREIAIRIALGVSRRRLTGQLFVESVTLAVLGGAFALLFAYWSGGLLRTLLLSNIHWPATVIDGRLVAFTMLGALLAGSVAGLAPATVAMRRDVMSALKSGAAESGRSRSATRVGLLVAQTALCMVMLAAAGVFLRSLQRAANFDLGIDADRLISFELFRVDQNVGDEALQRIRMLRGVSAVSRGDMDFRSGTFVGLRFANGDSVPVMSSPTGGHVDTAYATTTGLRVLNGRFFNRSDVKGGEQVVVINQAMADEYWSQRNPVGDCFHVGAVSQPCRRIVGVVNSIRWEMTAPAPKMFYMPAAQAPWPNCCSSINVRTRGRATGATVAEIRQIVSALPGVSREYPPR